MGIPARKMAYGEHVQTFLASFSLDLQPGLPIEQEGSATRVNYLSIDNLEIPVFINEFWTSRQRQSSSIHEVSYRACFKAELPRFFIELLTEPGDTVYDPFGGRGTTAIEAGLLGRRAVLNDINPLSRILSEPRFFVPRIEEVSERLGQIPWIEKASADIDLSMFYHPDTEAEIVSIREYLRRQRASGQEDHTDRWIRMTATNRLTGHSTGFFSVYTLPPNQAVTPDRQRRINEKRNQTPEYRNTTGIILRKTRNLIAGLTISDKDRLRECGNTAIFLCNDASETKDIPGNSISLTVTSPPFLDVVQYASDNWLRCWFNDLPIDDINTKITMARNATAWGEFTGSVFVELFRITKPGGWVAFEVGEVKAGKIRLEEYVVPAGVSAGFHCEGILINEQVFTKTANIWGVSNNSKGTNSNRVVLFRK